MPKRIQWRRTKGFRLPPNTLCITRPSALANPYPVRDYGRARALELFTAYLDALDPVLLQMRLAQIREADYLACFCKPEDACHGDIWIARAAAWAQAEEVQHADL